MVAVSTLPEVTTLVGISSGIVARILASVGLVALVVLVRFGVGRLRKSEDNSRRHVLLSSVVAVVTAGVVVSLLGVWGLGAELTQSFENLEIRDQFGTIVLSVVVLASAYVISDFTGELIHELADEEGVINRHQEEVLQRITQLLVYAISAVLVLGMFTDSVGSILAGAGFLGIVVGIAARKTLAEVLAGFVVMFSRPFEVGDWVEIGDHEGVVEDVTIINTRIRSADGNYITIPNDEVRSTPVVDRSWQNRLRVEIEVGVDYDADPEHAASVVLDSVKEVDGLARSPKPDVVIKRLDSSAVVLGVRYWIRNPTARKRWRTQTAVVAATKRALDTEGIEIPFPKRSLSGEELGVSVGNRDGTPESSESLASGGAEVNPGDDD